MFEAKTVLSKDKISKDNIHVWEIFPSEYMRHAHGESSVVANVHTCKSVSGQIIKEEMVAYW